MVCGPAAAAYIFASKDIVGYINMAISLYINGKASYGCFTIEAGSDLRSHGPNDYKWYPKRKPEDIDWMVLSSMRDDENWLCDFEGDPSEAWSGITMPGEMEDWLEYLMGFKSVEDNTNIFSTKGLDHMKKINSEFSKGKFVILLINHNMLNGITKKGAKMIAKKKGNIKGGLTAAFPDHYVVLKSKVEVGKNNVKMKIWSWGKTDKKPRIINKEVFKENYYGAIFAK